MLRPTRLVATIAGCLVAAAATAQIPDEFTNLQMINPEIEKNQLVSTMRNWATGLGVRCNHCHVGPDNLVGMDFAADEKPPKQTARRMLQLTRAVNRELLAELPTVIAAERDQAQIVSCYTCHRGQITPPRNLVRMLGRIARTDGSAAMLEEYGRLRDQHFGAGLYDFSPATLNQLAIGFAQAGQVDDARAILEANASYYPESVDTHLTMAMLEQRSGNREAALAAIQRALEIDPDNPDLKAALEALQTAPEE